MILAHLVFQKGRVCDVSGAGHGVRSVTLLSSHQIVLGLAIGSPLAAGAEPLAFNLGSMFTRRSGNGAVAT